MCFLPPDDEVLIYMTSVVIVDCIIPLVLMVVFYRKMSKKLKSDVPVSEHTQIDRNQKRKLQACRTVFYLVVIYGVFVVPGRFFVLVADYLFRFKSDFFDSEEGVVLMYIWKSFIMFWIYINNFANIFIYAAMMKDFTRFLVSFGCKNRCH